MKIGILTHHFVNNFGAFLQAYALREALAKEYPEDTVEIIDFINIKQYLINSAGWFRYYRDRENLKCWRQKIRMPRSFAKARKQHMTLSKCCYSAKAVNRLGYDMIVFGSDEIWNYEDKRSFAPVKFGCGITCKNKIAYAPSVGNSAGRIPDCAAEGIKQFRALSSRDELTSRLVEEITGTTPRAVLDPTFLAEFPQNPVRIKKPYILFYYCDRLPKEIKDQIFAYAKEQGLAVYGAGEADVRFDEMTVRLTPFQWVDLFRNAEFVFTGTFHGAVFSILNQRRFKVYLTNKSRIQKVNALLRLCQIEDRQIEDGYSFDLAKEASIDYEKVCRILKARKGESIAYLRDAVALCRTDEEAL